VHESLFLKEQNNRFYVYEKSISAPAVDFMEGQVRNESFFRTTSNWSAT